MIPSGLEMSFIQTEDETLSRRETGQKSLES